MTKTDPDFDSQISAERMLVATLFEAARAGETTIKENILSSVKEDDFADQASEVVFHIVKQLIESRVPVSRAVVEAAEDPPGVFSPIDRAAVLDTPPITDDSLVKAAIETVTRAAGLRRARVALEDAATAIGEA
ncbi:MAG TPA: hypothetical protein PKN33_15915, partial [Phycisphaerae bacterium]|nr:hypothetical protein [Phycisphaerae bacterium]